MLSRRLVTQRHGLRVRTSTVQYSTVQYSTVQYSTVYSTGADQPLLQPQDQEPRPRRAAARGSTGQCCRGGITRSNYSLLQEFEESLSQVYVKVKGQAETLPLCVMKNRGLIPLYNSSHPGRGIFRVFLSNSSVIKESIEIFLGSFERRWRRHCQTQLHGCSLANIYAWRLPA